MAKEKRSAKEFNEFLASENKAERTAGCWLESDAKKEDWEKMKEGRPRPLGLDEPSGLTVGPHLIGRPVSAWMTTKQD